MQKINAIVAGRGTIGLPLIDELKRLGHSVLCSFTRKQLWRELATGSERIKTLPGELTETTLAESLDCYCAPVKDVEMKADVAFIAIPSSGKGEEEMALIKYFRSRGVHIIAFAKGAFAYRYRELQPHLDHIGRRGVVGGRVGVLQWLQMHNLCDKDVTMHAVLNASNNMFFDECHKGYRSVLGAWIPGISGKFTFFRKVTSRDILPLRCLNDTPQSVNGLVLRRNIHALSHRSAEWNDWKPLMLLSRACMCKLNDSMRLLVWGQWSMW